MDVVYAAPVVPSGTVVVLMDGDVSGGVLLSPPHPARNAVMNANNKNTNGDRYFCRTRIVLRKNLSQPSSIIRDLSFGRLREAQAAGSEMHEIRALQLEVPPKRTHISTRGTMPQRHTRNTAALYAIRREVLRTFAGAVGT